MKISTLEPKIIWKHFSAINAIPRGSNKEEEISAYIVEFGNALGLETTKDKKGNVIVKKPATQGKEQCKTVVLQGHLDMVHQKEASSSFDFDRQGIQMFVDGDWVKAKDTTLGADNGIGVAAIMALLSSNEFAHPAIEGLFTVDEEIGMTGAMALTDNQLNGELLLNLDSEEDDEITIGCAGGVDVEIKGSYQIKKVDTKTYEFHEIQLNNLTGGHSGVDIHLNGGNAILILAEIIGLVATLDCRLDAIHVGTLPNVIPRNGSAILAVPLANVTKFKTEVLAISEKIKWKYLQTDPELTFKIIETEGTFEVFDKSTQGKLLAALLKVPNGVYSMTDGTADLVQTSNNVSVINAGNGSYDILCHTRSSVDNERDLIVNMIKTCFSFANVKAVAPYPGWKPNPKSNLLAIAKKCYADMYGVLPKVSAVHAGLECGIIAGVYPNMEMISIGPNILNVHSPQERLQISSTQKFWKFLTQLLDTLE